MFCAKRVEKSSEPSVETEEESPDDIFAKGIQSILECSKNKDVVECAVALREDTGKAVLTVYNEIEEPVIPKGFHDIQYIGDQGVKEK